MTKEENNLSKDEKIIILGEEVDRLNKENKRLKDLVNNIYNFIKEDQSI